MSEKVKNKLTTVKIFESTLKEVTNICRQYRLNIQKTLDCIVKEIDIQKVLERYINTKEEYGEWVKGKD